MYAYVPEMIKYYLGEDMILPNVPTFVCGESDAVRARADEPGKLVIKPD